MSPKSKFLTRSLSLVILGFGLVYLTGCASKDSTKGDWREGARSLPPSTPFVFTPKPFADSAVVEAAAKPSAPFEGTGWKTLFNGKTLSGWQISDFGGVGKIDVESGILVIQEGATLSGISWTNVVVRTNYEVALDAMKLEGSDFFCGLTFPVADSFCTLVLGGWGGSTVGLSSVDDEDASENETARSIAFEKNRWYRVRVRVTADKIEAWLDANKIVDLKTKDRKINLRFGDIALSKPLGLATYQTSGAYRNFKIRSLDK